MKYLLASIFLMTTSSHAVVIYSEADSGDISNFIQPRTELPTLVLGDNTITGTLNEGNSNNIDIFNFNVPTGMVLTSLTYDVSTLTQVHFIALANPELSFLPEELYFAGLISGAEEGTNILEEFSDGGNAASLEVNGGVPTGYTLPLTEGEYTIWFQENNEQELQYSLTLTTASVPEPSSTLLILGSSLLLLMRKRQ